MRNNWKNLGELAYFFFFANMQMFLYGEVEVVSFVVPGVI